MHNVDTQQWTAVRMEFSPYSPTAVSQLLQSVHLEFGRDISRWYWKWTDTGLAESIDNHWAVSFFFRDPHDAMLFALKYVK